MKNKKAYEIVILGRGGQGAKSLGEMIAKTAGMEGKYTQAFPEFGPERSGAPIKAFIRISENKIRTRQPIVDPDCLLVLDENLLTDKALLKKLDNNEPIIINTPLSERELKNKWRLSSKVFPIDATGLSQDIFKGNFPNLGVLGKFIFATEQIKLEDALATYEKTYAEKIGQKKVSLGKKTIQVAYELV